MSGQIRLGCTSCDREDFDGVDELPTDWDDIDEVRSFAEATREVDFEYKSRSPLDWHTHLGVCPESQAIHG